MNVRVYSTAVCAFCRAEKEFLKQNNVSFEEKSVDVDAAAQEEMLKESRELLGSPAMGVPFTVITKDDGTKEAVLGFDQPKLKSALGI